MRTPALAAGDVTRSAQQISGTDLFLAASLVARGVLLRQKSRHHGQQGVEKIVALMLTGTVIAQDETPCLIVSR